MKSYEKFIWKMSILGVISLLFFVDSVNGQPIQAPPIERPDQAPPMEPIRTVLPYSEALEVARKTGKPLIVWGGDAFCPLCVVETKDEFIHSSVNREDPRFWIKENGKVVKDTLMLAIRDGSQMKMVAHLGEWKGNHLPTLRKALRLWDQRQTEGLPEKTIKDTDLWTYQSQMYLLPPIPPPAMQMQVWTHPTTYQPMQYQPMRMAPTRFRGGASCST